MNATQQYEKLTEEVRLLKEDAWDTQTMSRSLSHLGDHLALLPTQGEVWDKARAHLVWYARDQGERMARMSAAKFAKADRLEQQGIRPI